MDNMTEIPKKLYRYCSLSKERLEYVLDIILKQRLYCAPYDKLNDPFEGIFETTIYASRPVTEKRKLMVYLLKSGKIGCLLKNAHQKDKVYKKVEADTIKICSLSSDLKDVRLWSYYADGHKGVVFEIDFLGLELKNNVQIIEKVTYDNKLPWSSSSTLLGQLRPFEVLLRKTKHWAFESEYRIISESNCLADGNYFDIKGRIKAIYLGARTSDIHQKLLTEVVPTEIPIWTTKINEKKIIVVPDKRIRKQ